MNVPAVVGVPLIVMVWFDHVAVTPGGNPEGVLIPVTPEVLCVMAVNGVLMHRVGLEEAAPTVLVVDTVMVPVALTLPQPPARGML